MMFARNISGAGRSGLRRQVLRQQALTTAPSPPPATLESIASSITALDKKFEAKFEAMDKKFEARDQKFEALHTTVKALQTDAGLFAEPLFRASAGVQQEYPGVNGSTLPISGLGNIIAADFPEMDWTGREASVAQAAACALCLPLLPGALAASFTRLKAESTTEAGEATPAVRALGNGTLTAFMDATREGDGWAALRLHSGTILRLMPRKRTLPPTSDDTSQRKTPRVFRWCESLAEVLSIVKDKPSPADALADPACREQLRVPLLGGPAGVLLLTYLVSGARGMTGVMELDARGSITHFPSFPLVAIKQGEFKWGKEWKYEETAASARRSLLCLAALHHAISHHGTGMSGSLNAGHAQAQQVVEAMYGLHLSLFVRPMKGHETRASMTAAHNAALFSDDPQFLPWPDVNGPGGRGIDKHSQFRLRASVHLM